MSGITSDKDDHVSDADSQTSLSASLSPSEAEVKNDLKDLDPPGERLRQAREAQGLGQQDIANELRLDLNLIQALEAGDAEHLPEHVFIAGYLRSYARFIGLPADELVAQYVSSETQDISPIDQGLGKLPDYYRKVADALPKSFMVSTAHRRVQAGIKQQVILLAGMVLVIFVSWQSTRWFASDSVDPAVENSQSVGLGASKTKQAESDKSQGDKIEIATAEQAIKPSKIPLKPSKRLPITSEKEELKQDAKVEQVKKTLQLKPLAGTEMPGSDSDVGVEGAAPAVELAQLSLRFTENSWVDIRDSTGKRLIRELGFKGATREISGIAPFQVLLGYGPGVEIAYNGKLYDFSRYQNQKIARFMLEFDKITGINEPLDQVDTDAVTEQEMSDTSDAEDEDESPILQSATQNNDDTDTDADDF